MVLRQKLVKVVCKSPNFGEQWLGHMGQERWEWDGLWLRVY